jgi:hypothetical protein
MGDELLKKRDEVLGYQAHRAVTRVRFVRRMLKP